MSNETSERIDGLIPEHKIEEWIHMGGELHPEVVIYYQRLGGPALRTAVRATIEDSLPKGVASDLNDDRTQRCRKLVILANTIEEKFNRSGISLSLQGGSPYSPLVGSIVGGGLDDRVTRSRKGRSSFRQQTGNISGKSLYE